MGGLDRNEMARAEKKAARGKPASSAAQRPATGPPRPRRSRTIDLDAAPDGYDANIWDLVLHFQQQAEHYGHDLATGRLVMYAKLERRIERSGIRDVTSFRRQALRWVPLVKVMIMDFWDHEVLLANVAYAIDQFCGAEMFRDLKLNVLREQELKLRREANKNVVPNDPLANHGRRRRAEEEEEPPPVPVRTKPRRSWDEIREAVARMNGRASE